MYDVRGNLAVLIGSLLCAGLAMSAEAASVGGEPFGPSLLANGDFEADVKGWHAGWNSPPGLFTHAPTGGRNNGGCVAVSNNDAHVAVLVAQSVQVTPGKTYKFSAWIKTDITKMAGDAGAMMFLEWNGKKGWIGGAWSKGFTWKTDWRKFENVATMPPGATTATAYLSLAKGARGRAWFDDVEMHELVQGEIELFVLQPDYRRTIWPEDRQRPIIVRVDISDAVVGTREPKTLRLESLLNGKVVRTTEAPAAGRHEIRLAASALKPGPWTVTVRLMAAGQKEPVSSVTAKGHVWPADKPKPRVWIDRHRRLIVDGKPFFPIGIYLGGIGASAFRPLVGTAFNTILPYACLQADTEAGLRKLMDDVQAQKLKIIFNVLETFEAIPGFRKQGWAGIKDEDKMLSAVVNAVKDHPALLGWYTNDEIRATLVPYLEGRYKMLRQLDPDHPTWIVMNKMDQIHYFLGTTDVLGVDPYPLIAGDRRPARVKLVADWARRARQASDGHGATWVVPQLFNYGVYYPEKLKDSRAPTEQEMRAMCFLALIEGTSALVGYSMFDVRRDPAGFDKRWKAICAVIGAHAHAAGTLLNVELPVHGVAVTDCRALTPRARARQSARHVGGRVPGGLRR